MINLFGLQLSVGETISICTILFLTVGGYFKILNRMESIKNKVIAIEEEGNTQREKIDRLETKVVLQGQTQASLAATLSGVQPQLQSVSNRLDTIISLMLTDKDKK